MRAPLLLAAVSLAACASADRLITIPTAHKLTAGTLRYESLREVSAGKRELNYFAVGIDQAWEVEFRTERWAAHGPRATADLTYNVVSPLAGISPGIAAGVLDVTGLSQDGRRYFACMTFREEADVSTVPLYAELTLGFFAGQHSSAFVGANIPLGPQIRLLAEHNGYRISAGVELRPIKNLAFRFLSRDRETVASVGYAAKF